MEALFYVFSIIAVFSALMVISMKNPLTSALYLVLCFFALAGFYVLLDMQFLAAMQILVYAGAIMVLVVLIIMLLNLSKIKKIKMDLHQVFIAMVIFIILLVEITIYILNGSLKKPTGIYTHALINKIGNTQILGEFLFTKYIFPFEVASVFLLVAIIGAYLFAKKKY
ncbi:MAG: NADH-quinone oxidoreductase subunit J [Deltaproteobacteria bacterium]|nr:NADH-quinone oxidoreductase subunit J [Deltaproteobacteria bacterium]MCL5879450.1 NADH-quinone oxidoreductase subunit J [Deltaproteobacteria bacterium]MDA8304464.1 NADH-quinone oxidoreductase subunit J [Deltaproteobacteria bacterium]